ncbi:MAG: hypothetical protein U0289_14150 [Cyclobacteriaceae bacterium]|mgnify:CR=1 FL=1
MINTELGGVRKLSKEFGLREKDLKNLLLKANVITGKNLLNPLAIESGIACQLRINVNGVYRNQMVYNNEAIGQMIQGNFKSLELKEVELPF